MRYLVLAFRSLFKKGQHNVLKIVSLAIGLAMGLLLLAKVFFLNSYDRFYPGYKEIYRVKTSFAIGEDFTEAGVTSGAVVPTAVEEIPGVEAGARISFWYPETSSVLDLERNRYAVERIGMVDTSWFSMFRTPVLAGDPGRIFSQPMGAMVSRELAEKMGGVGKAVGKRLYLDEYPAYRVTVEGVFEDLPENSSLSCDVLLSIHCPFLNPSLLEGWMGGERFASFVRLAPGTDLAATEEAFNKMLERHVGKEALEKEGIEMKYSLLSISEVVLLDSSVRTMLRILVLLAVVLLVVSVLNYGLVSVSGIMNRTREIAVRKCYGAGNASIFRLSVAETALHMFLALLLAILIVLACGNLVEQLLNVSAKALLLSKGGIYLLLTCVLLVVLTSVLPARFMGRIPVSNAFRNLSFRRRSWKTGLLVFQFMASAFVLCLLAGVSRQYHAMVTDDPGYDYENLAYLDVRAVDTTFRNELAQELERLPEVKGTALATSLLHDGSSGNVVFLPGSTQNLLGICDLYFAGDRYFDVTGVEVVQGTSFSDGNGRPDQIMVSESFVEAMKPFVDWPDGPVGKHIGVTEHSLYSGPFYEICGIFKDVRVGVIGEEDTRPSVLFYSRDPRNFQYMMVAFHHRDAEAMVKVREVMARLLPNQDVFLYAFRDEIKEAYRDTVQFRNQVLLGGIVCLLITLAGLLGYLNDDLARRWKEIAVRRVHGATMESIQKLFSKDILWASLPAMLVGALLAYAVLARWLQQFSVQATMPWWLFVLSLLPVCVLAYGCMVLLVARFAGRNPVEGLRSE